MAREFDSSIFSARRSAFPRFEGHNAATVSFAQILAASESFKSLFREGMALVEETAGYLDGVGRDEAKLLRRSTAMAYANESMRLTTRLMQLASWLLLQRAVNEGEMTSAQARLRKAPRPSRAAGSGLPPELFEELAGAPARPQRAVDAPAGADRPSRPVAVAAARPERFAAAEPDRQPDRASARRLRRPWNPVAPPRLTARRRLRGPRFGLIARSEVLRNR